MHGFETGTSLGARSVPVSSGSQRAAHGLEERLEVGLERDVELTLGLLDLLVVLSTLLVGDVHLPAELLRVDDDACC